MEIVPLSFRERLKDVFATYGASFFWLQLWTIAIFAVAIANANAGNYLHPLSATLGGLRWLTPVLAAKHQITFGEGVIFAPVIEEAVFRLLPLSLALRRDRGDGRTVRIVSLVVCGFLFGIGHGSLIHVFMQGAVGFLLARLFVRNSRPSVFIGYLCCVAVHAACNFSIMFAALMRM